jgi:xylulokinase
MAAYDADVRFVNVANGQITVGVDVGTTSVKAVAVDGEGTILARARVPHRIITTEAGYLEHDARRAWRTGATRAYAAVKDQVATPISGVGLDAMVPSMTAVNRRGIPQLPGLLYGDERGRPSSDLGTSDRPPGTMPDAEGFLRWAAEMAPDAAGYWPCQAVASHALCGVPAIDTAVTTSLGALHHSGVWNQALLTKIGVREEQLPTVVPMLQSAGTIPGSDTVVCAGTIDALCDQIVAGATEPGDVMVLFGATLIVWVVSDAWQEFPGLISVPHTVAGRTLIGGPSNAGALFVDWVRQLLGVPMPKADSPRRTGDPHRVPVWLPYLRGERTPFNDPDLRASVTGLDISQGPGSVLRGAYEASGHVIRRMMERSGIECHRIIATGGGTRNAAWMAAVADVTGLPVQAVAVPEGAAFGAAFLARIAAGLESSLEDASRWARTGWICDPEPEWTEATQSRFARFDTLGTGP